MGFVSPSQAPLAREARRGKRRRGNEHNLVNILLLIKYVIDDHMIEKSWKITTSFYP
jgi:hypothetical protein